MTRQTQAETPPVPAVALLAALMAVQSGFGLLRPDIYRDADWIRAAWYGNDWVTLLAVAPALIASGWLARRGSTRGLLVMCGCLAYGVYNYAYYLLGASLNVCFPVYAALLVASAALLVRAVSRLNLAQLSARFDAGAVARPAGAYFVGVAAALATVWLLMWAAFAFFDRPTPVEPDAFRLVAALDLTMMVPALAIGGVELWRRRPWGFLVAPIAGVLSALYLLVLTAGSIVAVGRGLVVSPGEAPLWGVLGLCTAAVTARLLATASGPGPAAPR